MNKRDRIIQWALKLFLEKGFANTKILDITQGAEVGKGTFYQYFPSKEAILIELLSNFVVPDYEVGAKAVRASKKDPKEKLIDYLLFEIQCTEKYGSNLSDFKTYLHEPGVSFSKEVQDTFKKVLALQYNCIHDIIVEGVENQGWKVEDPVLATVHIIGSISMYLHIKHGGFSLEHDMGFMEVSPQAQRLWDDSKIIELILYGLRI